MEVIGQLQATAAWPPRKDGPYYWRGDRVDTTAGLDALEKSKISCPCRESNFDSSIVQPVALIFTQTDLTQLPININRVTKSGRTYGLCNKGQITHTKF
jgi:hypothetical protein